MTVQEQITAEALRQGIDPQLALAVAYRESGYNQAARGSSGEVGVFQLMPGTAAQLGVNPYDLLQNISGGIRYLKQQISRFGTELGLQAYNAGPGRVASGNVPAASREYSAAVLARAGAPAGFIPPSNLTLPTLSTFDALGVSPWTIGAIAAAAGVALLFLTRR